MKRQYIHTLKGTVIACVTAVAMTGCSGFLDVDPKHEASETQQWKSLEDTRSALIGMYGLMRSALVNNNMYWATNELRAGDFTVLNNPDLQAIVDNNLSTNIDLIDEIGDWNKFYAAINAANVFIERAPGLIGKDKAYSEETLAYDLAQARAIRALAYYFIAKTWGDAPLITVSYDNGQFPLVPQSSQENLMAYAKKEFLAIADEIPFIYGSNNSRYYRETPEYWQGKLINRIGVYAMLAHIAALESRYTDVETYTSYALDNISQTGLSGASLTVAQLVSATGYFCGSATNARRFIAFGFAHVNNESTSIGHIEDWTLASPYVPKSSPDIYLSPDTLASMFDDSNDLRFCFDNSTYSYRTDGFIDMSARFPIFKKFNIIQDGKSNDGDYAVYSSIVSLTRYEDLVLLRAEALAVLNRPTESLALLNEMRTNRGLQELAYKNDLDKSKSALIREIFKERRREFVGEGMAWEDLMRRQNLLKDNDRLQELMDNGGIYWPISTKVLAKNTLIKQNAYWKR